MEDQQPSQMQRSEPVQQPGQMARARPVPTIDSPRRQTPQPSPLSRAEQGLLPPTPSTGYGVLPPTPGVARDQISASWTLGELTPLTTIARRFPLPPEDSVYSYFMFIPPIEQRRTKRFVTSLISFAFVLVFVNFVMQAGLLYVVGQHIMRKHVEWVSTLANLKHHAWYHVFPMAYNIPPPKCQGKDSPLCFRHGDGISCSPLSVHVLADWDLLDTDGDGVWSREEAENEDLRESIKCEYHVDLSSLYDTTVKNINGSHALAGRRDSSLFAGAAVHKAYLDWYLHKPIICQFGDQDMCGALFERGFFDEALKSRVSPEFRDTTTALEYCNNLLKYECFDILPNTYRVWRFTSNQQCGTKIYGQELYSSPAGGGSALPMLTVDFKKRAEYASTKSVGFRLFLGILLVTFLSVMALEMRSIMSVFVWCANFPTDNEIREDGRIVGRKSVVVKTNIHDEEEADAQKFIYAVRSDHRRMVFLVTLLRLLLWVFLLWSGIMFLTGPPRYLTLIFDALSLVFIFEIDELLYKTMLRTEFKNDHMSIADMSVPSWHGGVVTGEQSVWAEIVRFLLVIVFAICVVVTYCKNELNPLLESLECLCSVQGAKCYEAQEYAKPWWDAYWSATLPASNLIINQLKAI